MRLTAGWFRLELRAALGPADVLAAAGLTAGALTDVAALGPHAPRLAAVVLAVACTASVAWRRRAPALGACTAATAMLAYQLTTADPRMTFEPYAVAFCYYLLGRRDPGPPGRSRPLQALITGYGVITLGIEFWSAGGAWLPQAIAGGIVFVVLPCGLGLLAARYRSRAQALATDTILLRREQEAHARRAADEERHQVARELHDVIGHCVSVMVIQAGAAQLVAVTDPAAARGALHTVAECGREALSDLHRIMDGAGQPDDLAGPAPGLDQLGALTARATEAGIRTKVTVAAGLTLPAAIGLTCYRIVQEALTNAVKHAAPGHAEVTVGQEAGLVTVTVRSTGGRAIADPPATQGTGYGLIGLRERVVLHGGQLAAGPCSGGYRVEARIPGTASPIPASPVTASSVTASLVTSIQPAGDQAAWPASPRLLASPVSSAGLISSGSTVSSAGPISSVGHSSSADPVTPVGPSSPVGLNPSAGPVSPDGFVSQAGAPGGSDRGVLPSRSGGGAGRVAALGRWIWAAGARRMGAGWLAAGWTGANGAAPAARRAELAGAGPGWLWRLRGLGPVWVDSLLAGVWLVALEAEALTSSHRSGPLALNVALTAGLALAGWWRRRLPLVFLAVVVALMIPLSGGLNSPHYATVTGIYAVLVPTYAVGAWEPRRRWAAAALLVWGCGVTVSGLVQHAPLSGVAGPLLAGGGAWTAGVAVRAQRELARALHETSARLAAEREDLVRLAVAGERARIARDLHSLVARNVMAMVVQAEAAQGLLADQGPGTDRAAPAMVTIQQAGRESLAEMRRILGVLRGSGEGPALRPQPGLDQVHALLQRARQTGQPVELTIEGEPGTAYAGVGLIAYRILEEVLGDARSPGELVLVTLRFGPDDLRLDLTATGPRTRGWPTAAMRARVAICGGELVLAPDDRQGRRMTVRLPRHEQAAMA